MPESNELATQVDQVEFTDTHRTRFLEIIGKNKTIGNRRALREAGVAGTKGQLAELLDDDLLQEAREARGYGDQQIRNEIARRAIEGVDEPVFHNGEIVGEIRKYSDRLLGMMAKAHLVEYRDQTRLEIGGVGGGPIQVEKREVSIVGVLAVLAEADALPAELAGPLQHLARTRDVLPAQPD